MITSISHATGSALYGIGQWVVDGRVRRGLLGSNDGGERFCVVETPTPVSGAVASAGGDLWARSEASTPARATLLHSHDGGKSWRGAWDGALGLPARFLAVPRADELWVTAVDQTVLVTRDRGRTWARVAPRELDPSTNPGIYVASRSAAVDPTIAGRIYVSYLYFGQDTMGQPALKLVRSDDFGATFVNATVPEQGSSVEIAVDGGSTLYLSGTSKLWRSRDGGETWTSADFPGGGSPLRLTAPGTRDHVVAIAEFPVRIWESRDGGASFRRIELPGDESRARLLATGPAAGRFLAWTPRGLEWTADAGATWSVLFASPTGATALVTDPTGALMAAGSGAVLTEDGARTFTALPAPWRTPPVALLAAAPSHLYAVTTSEVFRSTDRGATWTSILTLAPGSDQQPPKADVAPDGSMLAVATPDRIHCSQDRGSTWSSLDVRLTAMGVDPTRPGRVLLARFPAPNVPSLGESVDGCRQLTWRAVTSQLFHSFAFLPRAVLAIENGVNGGVAGRIARSEDGGLTWSRSEAGLDFSAAPGTGRPAQGQLRVMVLGQGRGPAVAVTGSIVHLSVDEGKSWRRLATPSADPPGADPAPQLTVTSVAMSSARPDSLFVLFPPDLTAAFPPLATPMGLFELRAAP